VVSDVDGDALVAVLGGRVAELHVGADVVDGETNVAVARKRGHGDRAVVVGRGDGPAVAVADRVAGAGGEGAVVASGHDHVTDACLVTAADHDAVACW